MYAPLSSGVFLCLKTDFLLQSEGVAVGIAALECTGDRGTAGAASAGGGGAGCSICAAAALLLAGIALAYIITRLQQFCSVQAEECLLDNLKIDFRCDDQSCVQSEGNSCFSGRSCQNRIQNRCTAAEVKYQVRCSAACLARNADTVHGEVVAARNGNAAFSTRNSPRA